MSASYRRVTRTSDLRLGQCNNDVVDLGALLIAGIGCAIAVYSWRWSVPSSASAYKMLTAKDPEPGSWVAQSLQFGRWAGAAFGAFLAAGGVVAFFASL